MRTRSDREEELVGLSVPEIIALHSQTVAQSATFNSKSVSGSSVGQMIREILEREFPTSGNRSEFNGGRFSKVPTKTPAN